jgi:hypothetical protein
MRYAARAPPVGTSVCWALCPAACPQYSEGRVLSLSRNEHNEPTAVEAEFHRDSKTIKAQVPLEDAELVISDSELRQTAVFWGLEQPPEKVAEAAMHSLPRRRLPLAQRAQPRFAEIFTWP